MKLYSRNKKRIKAQAQIITVILIILLVLAAIVIVWQVIKSTIDDEPIDRSDCLEKIAIKECENRNMSYVMIKPNFGKWTFFCKEDQRETEGKEYNLFESEVESCK